MVDFELVHKSREMQGQMNELANSIELVLDYILTNNLEKSKKSLTLGKKISLLENKIKDHKIQLDNRLVERLKEFNKIWILMKHGVLVGNIPYTYLKDKVLKTVTPEEFEKICSDFTKIQIDLLKLNGELSLNPPILKTDLNS